jgi:Flp pilus assembly pilin Flp
MRVSIQSDSEIHKHSLSGNSDRGAITVEYALCMAVAAVLMIGVEMMFNRLAIDIIHRFKQIVMQFPDI